MTLCLKNNIREIPFFFLTPPTFNFLLSFVIKCPSALCRGFMIKTVAFGGIFATHLKKEKTTTTEKYLSCLNSYCLPQWLCTKILQKH
jgi:hypothetical protein